MAQAQLDFHANECNYKLIEKEEIPTIRWSDEALDHWYVDTVTERHMETLLSTWSQQGGTPKWVVTSPASSFSLHHTDSLCVTTVTLAVLGIWQQNIVVPATGESAPQWYK